MIDRTARDVLADALTHLASGQWSNDDFEAALIASNDPACEAVYARAWALYDDNYEHKLTGRHRVEPAERAEIAKWIVFLQSDLPYEWPPFSFMTIYNWPMNLLTFGWWERQKRREFEEFTRAGDWSVWPFIRAEDFAGARLAPHALAARAGVDARAKARRENRWRRGIFGWRYD